jgi:tetratricopeptide (TPR) repeat protein
MKCFKIIALVILSVCTLAPGPLAKDDDILDLLPAAFGKHQTTPAVLRQMFTQKARVAESGISPADKSAVNNLVAAYPDDWQVYDSYGPDQSLALPPVISDGQGNYRVVVATRADAYYLTGCKAVQQGSRDVALWCFCEAARRVPQAATYLNNAAFALSQSGYLAEALNALKFATTRAPNFTSLHVNLGAVYAARGEYGSAAEYYAKAFASFPNNPSYLILAAKAYKQAEHIEAARALGKIGKSSFPQAYDWDAFLASLPETPTYDECAQPNCFQSSPCFNFYNHVLDTLVDIAVIINDYENTIRRSALDRITEEKAACDDAVAAGASTCANLDICCHKVWEVESAKCMLAEDRDRYQVDREALEFYSKTFSTEWGKIEAELAAITPKLKAQALAEAQCHLNHVKSLSYLRIIDQFQKVTGWAKAVVWDINWVQYSLEQAWGYCASPPDGYIKWVFTGKITPGLAPTYCLGIACLSFDFTKQEIDLKIAFGAAVEFTYKPFDKKIGVNLGMGFQGGLGPVNLQGVIWVRGNDRMVGLEPVFSFVNAFNAGFFLGFENLEGT